MALTEFELIERLFTKRQRHHSTTLLGIGDDCALIDGPGDRQLAITTDTLVEGVHFFPQTDPQALGHKALAVNLSDLAAMGAEPAWVTLALTLPEADQQWLEPFADGFFQLARRHRVDLIGGDTTQGPLSITVQAIGHLPRGKALLRANAQPGDRIYLTGPIGDAALGLAIAQQRYQCDDPGPLNRLHRPQPQVEVGMQLHGIANAAIDISDGLIADLGHICQASGVGAVIEWQRLPFSSAVQNFLDSGGDWTLPLHGGDDYELCFTVPGGQIEAVEQLSAKLDSPCCWIGEITASTSGVQLIKDGILVEPGEGGYQHFSPPIQ